MDSNTSKLSNSDNTSSPSLICESCGKEYQNRSELFKHMNEHIEERADEVSQDHQHQVEDTLGAWERVGSRYECPICGYTRNTKSQIQKHMDTHDEEEEDIRCQECPYQTNNKDQLMEHIKRTHTKNNHATFKCNMCDLNFRNQREVNTHNKNIHRKSYKPCRNFPTNNCEYDSECHFDHIILNQGEHVCYKCGEVSKNKTLLMKHISIEHGEEICKKFLDNKCQFGNKCMFKHPITHEQNVVNNLHQNSTEQTSPVFSNPPSSGHQTLMVGEQKMYEMMNHMMSQMMKSLNLNQQ